MLWLLEFDPAAAKEFAKLDRGVLTILVVKVDRRDSAYE